MEVQSCLDSSLREKGSIAFAVRHPISIPELICSWATVKARMQERGTERGTEVMWFHTGNYDVGSLTRSHNQR